MTEPRIPDSAIIKAGTLAKMLDVPVWHSKRLLKSSPAAYKRGKLWLTTVGLLQEKDPVLYSAAIRRTHLVAEMDDSDGRGVDELEAENNALRAALHQRDKAIDDLARRLGEDAARWKRRG